MVWSIVPEPNSLGSRERSVALARAADSSRAEVARRFWFSKRTLYTWLERDKSEGTVTPHPHCGTGGTAVDAAGLVILRSIVKQQNDRMLEEYVALFAEETGIRPNKRAFDRAFARGRMTITRKKPLRALEQDRDDLAAESVAFCEEVGHLEPSCFLFVHETAIKTDMVRFYA